CTNPSSRVQTRPYILFALVALLLVTDELRPSARVYLVFPLLVIWANVHGSVILAAALVALRGVTIAWTGIRSRREPKRWLARACALLVVPWLCTIVSPYGLDLLHYYPKIVNNPALGRLIGEWHATTIRNQPQFFVLLFGACWLAFRRGSTLGLFSRLGLLLTAVAGLSALRHMVWFCLLAVAVLPPALDAAWPPKEAPRHRRINLAIAAASLIALVVAIASIASHSTAWFEHTYPQRAGDVVARAAATDPRLRVYADGRYADWLLFGHPGLAGRLAYDVRYELLTQHELEQLSNFVTQRGTGWFRDAAGYRLLVLDPVREPGAIAYYRLRGARVLYSDEHVVVLEPPAS